MKNIIEISAMHDLRIGELQELQRRIDSFAFTPELLEKKAMYDDDEDRDEYRDYAVINGTAVYKISGPLLTSSSFFTRWFGYSSYEDVRANMLHAVQNPEVQDILLFISSPGGSAFGVTDGAEAINKVAAVKPVYAFTNSNMASGAYWLGSQAKKLFVSPESETGSIGVIVTHVSYQKQLEDDGVKVTRIRSSEMKAIGGSAFDLTDKEIAHIQDQVDTLDTLFKESVQKARPKVKLSAMNGATYIGAEAVKVGLADAVMSFDDVMSYIASERKTTNSPGGYSMNKEELRIALDAGATLEDLNLTQEEVDAILAEVEDTEPKAEGDDGAEPKVEGDESAEPKVEDGAGIIAELNTKLAEAALTIEAQAASITTLEAQIADFEANVGEMKGIVAEITANRRTALGFQSTVDLTKFSTATLLEEYKAVTEEFSKQFKTGGILRNKNINTEEPKPASVKRNSLDVGRLKGADITRKNS